MVLTPDGRISRYFYGVEYPGRDMRLGLSKHPREKSARPSTTCCCSATRRPQHATYSTAILRIVRLGGVFTILCIVGGILIFRRRDARSQQTKLRQPLSGCPERGAH